MFLFVHDYFFAIRSVNRKQFVSISLLKSTLVKMFFLLLSRTENRLAQEILSQHAIDVNFAPINVYWRRMEVRVSSALANVTAQLNGAKHFLNLHFNLEHFSF